MKPLRVWILVLLAVLLPVRGALAATMLCGTGMAGVQTELQLGQHPAAHGGMDHAMDHHPVTPPGDASGHHGEPGQDQAAADKCNVCSANCSSSPLAATAPALHAPPGLAAVERSDHAAPPPSFLSGGQERPPRTS